MDEIGRQINAHGESLARLAVLLVVISALSFDLHPWATIPALIIGAAGAILSIALHVGTEYSATKVKLPSCRELEEIEPEKQQFYADVRDYVFVELFGGKVQDRLTAQLERANWLPGETSHLASKTPEQKSWLWLSRRVSIGKPWGKPLARARARPWIH